MLKFKRKLSFMLFPHYLFHVEIEEKSLPIFSDSLNKFESLFVKKWAGLDNVGIDVLKGFNEEYNRIDTIAGLSNFNSYWSKNMKKMPLTLVIFLHKSFKAKIALKRDELWEGLFLLKPKPKT